MADFRRYSPPNLPSLSQQDRVAWAGLTQYLNDFEGNIASRVKAFGTIAERDEYYSDPQLGDMAYTSQQNGDDSVPTVLWVYTQYVDTGGNVYPHWSPYDQHWVRYTPTLTNLTDGSAQAFYKRSGVDCRFQFEWAFSGGTPAVGSNPTFSLPFEGTLKTGTQVGGAHTFGFVFLIDNDSTDAFGATVITADPFTSMIIQYLRSDTAFLANASVSAAAPFVWAANDRMIAHGEYEMHIPNIAPFTV